MKKSVLIALAFVLIMAAGYSYGVEVTLLGPKQYTKTSAMFDIINDPFPGQSGPGYIVVQNNGVDGLIKINGVLFARLNKGFQTIEKQITLQKDNVLTIDLRSKPGTSVSITIKQDVEAEAATVVGPSGGTVFVADMDSPIFGVQVDIPPGALGEPRIFSVSLSEFASKMITTLPEDFVTAGVPCHVEPDGVQFNSPATIRMPYYDSDNDGILDGTKTPEEDIVAFVINSEGEAVEVPIVYQNVADNFVIIETTHFSDPTLAVPARRLKYWPMNLSDSADWVEESYYLGSKTPLDPGLGHIEFVDDFYTGVEASPVSVLKTWIDPPTEADRELQRSKWHSREAYPSDGAINGDIYSWRVYIPSMEEYSQVGIAAFLYESPETVHKREVDFEIGYGTKEDREAFGIDGKSDYLVCTMTAHYHREGLSKLYIQGWKTIKCNRWYLFQIRMNKSGTDTEIIWYVDGHEELRAPFKDYDAKFFMFCSVECLDAGFLGDNPPTEQVYGYYDEVSYSRSDRNTDGVLVENFESTEVGAIPTNWSKAASGVTIAVSNLQAHEGTKSLNMRGSPYNGSNIVRPIADLNMFSGIYKLTFWMYADTVNWTGTDGYAIGHLEKDGYAYAMGIKKSEGIYRVCMYGITERIVDFPSSMVPNAWNRYEVIANLDSKTAEFYLNGVYLGENSTPYSPIYDRLHLAAGASGPGGGCPTVFYDLVSLERVR